MILAEDLASFKDNFEGFKLLAEMETSKRSDFQNKLRQKIKIMM